jgi:hypothetical protein
MDNSEKLDTLQQVETLLRATGSVLFLSYQGGMFTARIVGESGIFIESHEDLVAAVRMVAAESMKTPKEARTDA